MSSILDALNKVEAAQTPAARPIPVWTPPRHTGRRASIGLAIAFVAGAGVTFWLRSGDPPTATPALPEPPRSAARVSAPPAPAPPAEEVATAPPAPAIETVRVEPLPPTPSEPPRIRVRARPPEPVEPVRTAKAQDERPIPPPAGAPKVRVSFLVFSPVAERRAVSLTIDDGRLITLREGESAHGIEVERIRSVRVDLLWNGAPFTVRTSS